MPLVTFGIVIKTGTEADPQGKSGLAGLTAELLTKGTETRSANEIVDAIEMLGGEITTGAMWDASSLRVDVLSSKLRPALDVLSEVVCRPSFEKTELKRLRRQSLDTLIVALREPGSISRMVASRVLYGDAPYGHPPSGTPESLRRIRQVDVRRFHNAYYRPDNAILIFCGDVRAKTAFALARKHFGDWPKPSARLERVDGRAGKDRVPPRTVVIDMPSAGQAAILVARQALRRSDPEYFAALVANSVLGGGYSARLNREIRIKRGLSYGAVSSVDARRDVGPFIAFVQSKNESAAQVASLVMHEMDRLGRILVGDAELLPRKTVLTGGFSRSLETSESLLEHMAGLALHDLNLDGVHRFIENIEAVTAAELRSCARTKLDDKGANLVVVGNAKIFLRDLRKRFRSVEVISLEDLDLNVVSLRKGKAGLGHR
jgi:zinc protease